VLLIVNLRSTILTWLLELLNYNHPRARVEEQGDVDVNQRLADGILLVPPVLDHPGPTKRKLTTRQASS
jgi:hypothetical protein